MARQNQVEAHPERVSIELARAAGISLDRIAAKFGVHRDAIHRHWKTLDAGYKSALLADVPREQLVERAVAESGNLLDHFKLYRSTVEEALILARAGEDAHAVSTLARTAIRANEAIGKLTGEIRAMPSVLIQNTNSQTVNVFDQPAFRAFEQGLMQLAEKHPAVRQDIRALLRHFEDAPAPATLELEAAHA